MKVRIRISLRPQHPYQPLKARWHRLDIERHHKYLTHLRLRYSQPTPTATRLEVDEGDVTYNDGDGVIPRTVGVLAGPKALGPYPKPQAVTTTEAVEDRCVGFRPG